VSDEIVRTFRLERETKNKVLFQEVSNGSTEAIGALYVSKAALKTLGDPGTLEVTIAASE
jgi:hypothetical protein